MKSLLTFLSGCVLLSSSLLSAEEVVKKTCECVSCECTQEAHCGCLAQEDSENNEGSENCNCGTACATVCEVK